MESILMMDDKELATHIEEVEQFDKLQRAVEEAVSRGYENLDEMTDQSI